ncbi:MAG TPA: hypothetical protein VMH41_16990 [Mycobacteriales bacterium]|nr:hypothetical protein [Mycobacteriales bacterium]
MKLLVYPFPPGDVGAFAASLGVEATAPAIPPRYAGQAPTFAAYLVIRETWASVDYLPDATAQQVAALPDPGPNPVIAQQANAATLRSRAAFALANNATYLGIASPTQGQAIAQVAALTRQTDGIIRLLLGALDSITDS